MGQRRQSTIREQRPARDGTRHGERVVNGAGFEQFWTAYPRKVGRLAAIKEWNKLKVGASLLSQILEGVRRYQRTKPAYADYCHPRTWLSQGRWMDEDDTPVTYPRWECMHEPRCETHWRCDQRTQLEQARKTG